MRSNARPFISVRHKLPSISGRVCTIYNRTEFPVQENAQDHAKGCLKNNIIQCTYPSRVMCLIANTGLSLKATEIAIQRLEVPGDMTLRSISRIAHSEEPPDLQFVNITRTTTIDDVSKRVIRKHASRHKAKLTSNGASINAAATKGQVHRFRLGPEGLKHTSNQPRQISQEFTILSLRSDEQPSKSSAAPVFRPSPGTARLGQAAFKSRQGRINSNEDGDEVFPESGFRTVVSQPLGDLSQEESLAHAGWAPKQHKTWLESLGTPRGVSLYSPSSGAMDPFNAMALTITPREQVLVRYYCKYTSKHAWCRFPQVLLRYLLSLGVISSILAIALRALKNPKLSPFLVNG